MSEASSAVRALALVYARCPDCNATLLVSAGELAQAGGVVACGECEKVFNALVNLFDTPPQPGQAPASGRTEEQGMPPTLRPLPLAIDPSLAEPSELTLSEHARAADSSVVLTPAQTARHEGDTDRAAEGDSPHSAASLDTLAMEHLGHRRSAQLPRPLWWVLAALLLTGLGYQGNTIWQYRQQWNEIQRLAEQTREPEAFRIISRDVHEHPSIQSAQLISLRMLNTAGHSQPYPVLEVSLLDTTQNIVAVRRFHADEYLPTGADPLRVVGANEDFALVLQLGTPIGGHGGMTFRVL